MVDTGYELFVNRARIVGIILFKLKWWEYFLDDYHWDSSNSKRDAQ